jgi:stage III sporulation protein AE
LGASALSVESVTEYFNGLFSSVAAFIPLSTVLYAMGGNFTAAGGGAVSLNLILGVCQFFCTQTAVPFFAVCLCLSLTSVFDGVGGGAGNALSATLRHWYLTSLSFVMMVISGAVGAQSLLSAKADNAAMKGMKFAASSFIPVSGGTVSSTLGTLAASVELLRSSVGTVGIAVIFLLLVPVVVELALLRLVLGIGGFCASVLGCSGEAKLLNELNSLYGYLEGVAVLSAVVFIVAFAIFACVAVPI